MRGPRRKRKETLHLTHTPEYRIWQGIIRRCENPGQQNYHRYGGRGVRICKQWRTSFSTFLADVGHRPGLGYSIDRLNSNGHYEPGNIRWATIEQQANNTRTNRFIEIGGVRLSLAQWLRRSSVPAYRFYRRIKKGW